LLLDTITISTSAATATNTTSYNKPVTVSLISVQRKLSMFLPPLLSLSVIVECYRCVYR